MRGAFGLGISFLCAAAWCAELPGPVNGGYLLPNGWRITPVGKSIPTEDLLLNLVAAPDGKAVIATHGGYNTHGLVVVDPKSEKAVQRIALPTAWLGLAWHPDGTRLYVSGGNNKSSLGIRAPIYVFEYAGGRLSPEARTAFTTDLEPARTYWSGLAHHPGRTLLFAANRGTGEVFGFDSASGAVLHRIKVEEQPYDLALSGDGGTLYCSNWASDTISVIDTETMRVKSVLGAGDNPSDLLLSADGRLFVCCANDNAVWVIDTGAGRPTEIISTAMYPNAPEGSTPNALALDETNGTLYAANADNNNICVIDVETPGESTVLGFIPTGWYPTAVCLSRGGDQLFIGNAKGTRSNANIRGPHSPLPPGEEGRGTIKSLTKGAITILNVPAHQRSLRRLTELAYANCPYSDELLRKAPAPASAETVVPREVGTGSPIKHVIYIIKENRTYDQVLGDLPQGNGDPRLAIFGREITPNHHKIAEEFVLLDNTYCDAEVSADGHSWSNAAYATDYNEKNWPASYGGKSEMMRSMAMLPGAGYIWDQCRRKGLTFRSYGEFAWRASEGADMTAIEGAGGLQGHVAPRYLSWHARDYENAAEFIREFEEYEARYDEADPAARLPNFIVMALPEDHTRGARPGAPTPRASVASNDYALGMIVDRVSHSRYWPELALFVIEDDAQDGPDHVDARRTVALVASPYCKRGAVDSTLYTTSSMLRTIELLLGLQPMSQYDAAATPMYASFTNAANLAPYTHVKPNVDLEERNLATAYGAQRSMEMDLSLYDRAPMFDLNEIVWKNMKGADSAMPVPVHRFHHASVVVRP